jgi:hypothetical protein
MAGYTRIFDLQDRVASSVIGAILHRLERAEIQRAQRKPTGVFRCLGAAPCSYSNPLSYRPQGRATHSEATALGKVQTVGLTYEALRKECIEAVRQWPGCETIGAIRLIREKKLGGFSVRIALYGRAHKRTADRAIGCVQREKRRHFHLVD